MTQPIAAAGAKPLHLPGTADTSAQEKAHANAASPEPVRVKAGVDSVSISAAARHQLSVNVQAGGDRPDAVLADDGRTGRGNGQSVNEKVETIMNDMRAAFHTRDGDDGFNASLDFNQDGLINVADMAMVKRKLADAMGQNPVTIVNDPMPASASAQAAALSAPQEQHQIDNSVSTLDALRASFYTREGEDGFNASVDFNKDGIIDARDLGLARRGPAEDTQPVAPSVTSVTPAGVDSAVTTTSASPNVTSADPAVSSVTPGTTNATPANDMAQMLADLRASFYSRQGEDGYNAAVDFNNDGIINVSDLALARAGGTAGDNETTQPVAPQALDTTDFGVRAKTLVQQLRDAFFSSRGEGNFNAALDSNGDGRINVADMAAARDRLRDESA